MVRRFVVAVPVDVAVSRSASASPRRRPDGAAPTELRQKRVTETLVEDNVQEEVRGRVDGQQEIGDLANALDEEAVRLGVAEIERRHDGVGDDADDERRDDDRQHDGDPVARRQLPAGGARPSEGSDDDAAGGDEDDERNDRTQQALKPVVRVREALVAPQRRQFDLEHRLVDETEADAASGFVAIATAAASDAAAGDDDDADDFNCPVAQRRRNRDRRHENIDGDDDATRSSDGRERLRARRVTHEHVALERQRDRQPRRHADGHVKDEVRVRIEMGVEPLARRLVEGEQEAGNEVENVVKQLHAVADGERGEEDVRRRATRLADEHDEDEDVRQESDGAGDRIEDETGGETRPVVEVLVVGYADDDRVISGRVRLHDAGCTQLQR